MGHKLCIQRDNSYAIEPEETNLYEAEDKYLYKDKPVVRKRAAPHMVNHFRDKHKVVDVYPRNDYDEPLL